MRILIATMGAALMANVAACGGDAPGEVPESTWVLYELSINPRELAGLESRPSNEEWAAECSHAGSLMAMTECTDDPVIAQEWAEVGESRFSDCKSYMPERCAVLERIDDEWKIVLPADQ